MDRQAVKLNPVFKDYLWGGTTLKERYNKRTTLEKVAESWELSTHKDGVSTIKGGQYNGLAFSEYIEINKGCLGASAEKFKYFPILIKFIDADGNLSVQVHPDDDYALKVEGEYGKTEMWYVVEADEGAYLYYGVIKGISKSEFKKRIQNNTLIEILNKVEVKKGDVFFIESGTIHAIGKGIVICEIQQNSNTTYRVYDYGRVDKNNKPRQLHIEKAIEVANLHPSPVLRPVKSQNDVVLASCDYFTVRKLTPYSGMSVQITDNCFHSLIITDGSGVLQLNDQALSLQKGDSVFIPAQNAKYMLSGKADIILTYIE